MSIVSRIQMKIKEKGLTIKALEQEVGIGNGTIRRWDERSPQCDKLSAVANYLNISLDWLVFGKTENDLTSEEQELLNYFRKLPAPEQQRELGRLEGKAEKYEDPDPAKLSS